jgi:hypothetical protein
MEPVCGVSRGKINKGDTEKSYYRNKTHNSADSPEPILRPSPAAGHDAEMLEVSDPDLGYDAEKFPYQQP